MLVHICCSVDSHYFLEKIKEEYPTKKIVGYFYDPNIHPYSEYALRLLDVQYSCKKLGIELIEGVYDFENWLKSVKGLEQEPEKGERCTVCFDMRLKKSVEKAKELACTSFTTTLLISPKKSQEKLEVIGNALAIEHNMNFIFKDYRSGNGTQLQGEAVKKHSLYRQNYCGCLFGLTPQRKEQNRLLDELMMPISKQILPQSIEARYELYLKRDELEEKNISYSIIKVRFLNYRLLSAFISCNKTILPSYILCYSTLNKEKASGRVEFVDKKIHYLNKNEIKLIELSFFNSLCNKNYLSVKELLKAPLLFEEELKLRQKLTQNSYDLSTIIVLDKIPENSKFDVYLNATTFEDVKESILIKGNL